jgi:hypothetical protein
MSIENSRLTELRVKLGDSVDLRGKTKRKLVDLEMSRDLLIQLTLWEPTTAKFAILTCFG